MQIFDTHAHLNLPPLSDDLDKYIFDAKESGVTQIMVVGADIASSTLARDIAEQYDNIYYAVGIHPIHDDEFDLDIIRQLADKAVAIGEVGLDYFHKHDKQVQAEEFRAQIKLAQELDLPLIIHARDAEQDALDILREMGAMSAVFHCYSGNAQIAQQIIEAGYHISFTNIITYPSACELREVVASIPLDKIMVETDCPYLPPQERRGQLCTPTDTLSVVKQIAEIKQLAPEQVAEITTQTAEQFFRTK